MSDFLFGWRRKAGCVALLITCVLMVGWVRSMVGGDAIAFGPYGVISDHGLILCWKLEDHFLMPYWSRGGLRDPFAGGYLLKSEMTTFALPTTNAVSIPYSSLTLPLAMLSTYLILWPGKRQKVASKPPEPT